MYLVALRDRVLDARGGLHVVGHCLVHRWSWSQNPVLEALGASREPALLRRKACILIIQTTLHSELILGAARRPAGGTEKGEKNLNL